jgi:hypothetical protein
LAISGLRGSVEGELGHVVDHDIGASGEQCRAPGAAIDADHQLEAAGADLVVDDMAEFIHD